MTNYRGRQFDNFRIDVRIVGGRDPVIQKAALACSLRIPAGLSTAAVLSSEPQSLTLLDLLFAHVVRYTYGLWQRANITLIAAAVK